MNDISRIGGGASFTPPSALPEGLEKEIAAQLEQAKADPAQTIKNLADMAQLLKLTQTTGTGGTGSGGQA